MYEFYRFEEKNQLWNKTPVKQDPIQKTKNIEIL